METSYRTALVTGGTGLIGTHFLAALSARFPRLDVTVATRSPWLVASRSGQTAVLLDLSKAVALERSADVVFHIAGVNRADRTTTLVVNYDGTCRLLDWATKQGVKRFVHVSSVAVYGAGAAAGKIDERSPHSPKNGYAMSKKRAEDAVKARCAAFGIEFVVLQPANVLSASPYKEAQLLNLMTIIKKGLFFYLGREEVTFNYVPAEAVAKGLCTSLAPAAANRTFILNTPCSLRHVVEWIADELGVRAPTRTLPKEIGWISGRLASGISRVSGARLPFSYPRFLELTMKTCYSGGTIVDALGFQYEPDLESTIRRLARRYIVEGRL